MRGDIRKIAQTCRRLLRVSYSGICPSPKKMTTVRCNMPHVKNAPYELSKIKMSQTWNIRDAICVPNLRCLKCQMSQLARWADCKMLRSKAGTNARWLDRKLARLQAGLIASCRIVRWYGLIARWFDRKMTWSQDDLIARGLESKWLISNCTIERWFDRKLHDSKVARSQDGSIARWAWKQMVW
jgi:hypothetical protein